jgi:cob(I)alamin adenosyltransferase
VVSTTSAGLAVYPAINQLPHMAIPVATALPASAIRVAAARVVTRRTERTTAVTAVTEEYLAVVVAVVQPH